MSIDRLSAKTGGLFNMKGWEKEKVRQGFIDQIIEHYKQNCIAQNIPYDMFLGAWKDRLKYKGIRDIKRELKLAQSAAKYNCK